MRVLWAIVLCVGVLLCAPIAQGQEAAAPPVEAVEAKIADLEARAQGQQTLSEVEQTVLGLLREVRQALSDRDSAQRLAADFAARVQKVEEERGRLGELSQSEQIASLRDGLEEFASRIDALWARAEDLDRRRFAPDLEEQYQALLEEIRQALAQAQDRLREATTELEAAQQAARSLRDEQARRAQRLSAIPDEIAKINSELAVVQGQLDADTTTGESEEVVQARQWLLLARREALTAKIEALNQEKRNYEARQDLLAAKIEAAQERIAAAQDLVDRWQRRVGEIRELEQRVLEALRRRAAGRHEVLERYAQATDAIVQEFRAGAEGTVALADIRKAKEDAQRALAELREEFGPLRELLSLLGQTRITGRILRRQYEALPGEAEIERRLRASEERLERIEGDLVDLEYRLRRLRDVDARVEELVAEIRASGGEGLESRLDDLRDAARQLVENRRSQLEAIAGELAQEKRALLELLPVQRELLEAVRAFRGFIEERIFWVRSITGGVGQVVPATRETLVQVADASAWGRVLARSLELVRRSWVEAGLRLVVVLGLFGFAQVGKRRLRTIAQQARGFRTDSMVLTVRALGWTVALALPISALMWAVAWALREAWGQESLGVALGEGLASGAWVVFVLMLLYEVLRGDGLALVHFRWNRESVRAIRRGLRWFIPVAAASRIVFVAMETLSGLDEGVVEGVAGESANASLGRLAFTVGMVASSWLAMRLLSPRGAVMRPFLERNRGGWIDRLRVLWYSLFVLLPLGLAAASWAGYHYTALRLEARFEASVALIIVLVLVHAMMMRWLFLARRRVALEEARRRREQAQEAEGEQTPIEADKLDLPAVSQQTQQLFRALIIAIAVLGAYLAWADVLPALRMLDRIELYPSLRVVGERDDARIPILEGGVAEASEAAQQQGTDEAPGEGQAPEGGPAGGVALPGMDASAGLMEAGDGVEAEQAVIRDAITLADLGLAIVILAVTLFAFRNVPGLVEIVVLQRLPLDAGSRYALSTVLRYVIMIIGVVAAFGAMGIGWKNVQWLAAALTFGLAFGLQEIFANFVSGLIILAERPIRIGDTVTVNGISGTVTRIRMRATTIRDWDRKELVVPNKQFITGELVNWTLTDKILRVIVPVGVAYGSDVDKVERLLRSVAEDCPFVLDDPAPRALFLGFGDSTLNFELRAYIETVDEGLTVKHELHERIAKLFAAEGVEIAFPQLDVHVREGEGIEQLTRAIGGGR